MHETDNSFYSQAELSSLGFSSIGMNCLISKKASFYGIKNMRLGDYVRIDDYCILTGSITLNNYIHISAYSALYGSYGIFMDDYSGMSPRSTIFSSSDDFTGGYLVGPMVEANLTKIIKGKVILNKYVQLGAGSIVLPNVSIGEGSVTGCFTMVKKNLDDWGIYVGTPARFLKKRGKIDITFRNR